MGNISFMAIDRTQFGPWHYAPEGVCKCRDFDNGCLNCTYTAGSGCECPDNGYCACGIKPHAYGGPIAIVEEGHPRLGSMQKFRATNGLRHTANELIKDERYLFVVGNDPRPDVVPFGTGKIPSTIQSTVVGS